MKKPYVESIVVCDYVTISEDYKLNILGIFDAVEAKKFPTTRNAFLVATLHGTPETMYELIIKFSPTTEFKSQDKDNIKVDVGENEKGNIIMEYIGLTFPKPGEYTFSIIHNKEVLKTYALHALKQTN